MKTLIAFITSGLVFFILACTQIVDVDVPISQPKIVVNSLFNPDSVWVVSVSTSRNILDNGSFGFPSGAEVTILDENEMLVSKLHQINEGDFGRYKGIFRSDEKPESGKLYTVRVIAPNNPIVTSKGKAPEAISITQLEIDSLNDISFQVTFNDPVSQVNYYLFRVQMRVVREYSRYRSDIQQFEMVRDTSNIQIPLYESSTNLLGNNETLVITDTKFNGKLTTLKFYTYGSWYTEVLEAGLVTYSLSEEYYKYLTTLDLQRSTDGDPFAQPVKVFTNVNNGLGIFAGYSTSYYPIKE